MSRLRATAAAGVAGVALIMTAGGAVTVVLAPGAGGVSVSAGTADAVVAWLLLGAAGSLVIAGVVAWIARPGSGLALIAFASAATSVAPELTGSTSVTREIRSLGLLVAPLALPLLVHLPVRALRVDRGPLRATVVGLYLATGVLALGHALTWSAYLVLECAPSCSRGDNVLGLLVDIRTSIQLRSAGWWLTLSGGAGLAVWALARLVRGRGRSAPSQERLVLAAAAFTGLVLGAWAVARISVPMPAADDPWSVRTTGLLAVAVIMLGSSVAWLRWGEGRRAAGVRGLVELLDAGAGTRPLAETLATVLRDPSVRVAYAMQDARRFVDDDGRVVPAPSGGGSRAVTPVERDGTLVALVEHDAGLDPDLLTREVGAAARLAVDNERLTALLRAQVRELQASRQRIVAAGDAARGLLERDLHDGAQQRLLAVSYELRLAQADVGRSAPASTRAAIDDAVVEIDRAMAELRQLAHGIWPAVLAEAGLEAALGSLADEAPIPVELTDVPDGRYPVATEAAAFLAVTEVLRRAITGGADALQVTATQLAGTFHLVARVPGLRDRGPWLRVGDRVGAAGGTSAVTVDEGGTLLTVELPCA